MPLNISLPTNSVEGGAGHPAAHNATNTAVNATAAAVDAHGPATTSVHGIADTSALATSSSVSSAISTHVAASDPHSDRAYTDTQISGRQPLDSDLTTIAGLTATTDNFLQAKSGAWASRTIAQVATDLGLTVITGNNQTGTTYTLVLADAGKCVEGNNASAITLTIPPNTSVAFPVGTVIEVFQQGAGQITVTAGSGVTLRAPDGAKTAKQYASASLRQRATDEWVLAGNVTT